ncbi:hypothetical protein RFI_12658, partial [Reticulomyxa filosa]
ESSPIDRFNQLLLDNLVSRSDFEMYTLLRSNRQSPQGRQNPLTQWNDPAIDANGSECDGNLLAFGTEFVPMSFVDLSNPANLPLVSPSFANSRLFLFDEANPMANLHETDLLSRIHSLRVSQHGVVVHNSPLLRRVHRGDLRRYVNGHKELLQDMSLDKFMETVRKVKPDTALTDEELLVIFKEWKQCIDREDFKFSDLHELDFLLFHLSLVVSRGLLSKFSVSSLLTLDEEAEVTLPFHDNKHAAQTPLLTPSFMDTQL